MNRNYRVLIFDLDDTLYSPQNGLWEYVRTRISWFMIHRVGIAPDEVDSTRQLYLDTYGTTLHGLVKHYQIDPMDFLDHIHPENMADYIHPDPALQAMLHALPQQKVIFTNSYKPHADRVLKCLGISDQFDTIVDILDMDLHNKPQSLAYTRLIELAGISDPSACIYVDDRDVNLIPAAALGMTTVHIAPEPSSPGGDYYIQTITELVEAVPGLLAGES